MLDNAPTAQKSRGFNIGAGGVGYTYDANGNLKSDSYKGISNIAYNHLNLPALVTFTNGNTLEFIYDAGGNKLRKIVRQNGVIQYEQDYAGELEYRKNASGSRRVESLYHSEGRYYNLNAETNNTLNWRKEYNLRDHLGNNRLTFADKNNNGIVDVTNSAATNEILQETHYYPFGLSYEGPWLMNDAARDDAYKYNGKEWDETMGLYDYGARWYDPVLGRWGQVDPLAKYNGSESPYVYVGNEPINHIDPNGGFLIPAIFRSKYPNLVKYIENQLQRHIENSDAISGALWYFSGGNLNPQQIAADFKDGSGPILKETDGFAIAYYDHPTPSNPIASIAINSSKLERIESILRSGSDQAKQIALIDFMRTFVNEYTHYGDALDGYDLIQTSLIPFVANDYSPQGAEPSRPNIFEEGNRASDFLYPSTDPVLNFLLFSQGIWSPGNSDEESKSKQDASKIPDPPRA